MQKRVVVWGTGFVGEMVISEIVRHPAFELVGVGVSNPDKVALRPGTSVASGPSRCAGWKQVEDPIATTKCERPTSKMEE